MRKNNVLLAAAIAATLVVPMSAAYAGFDNYMGCPTGSGTSSTSCIVTLGVSGTVTPAASHSVIPMNSSADGGVKYGTHLFGATGNSVVLPSKQSEYAVAEWTVEGTPGGEIQVTAELEGASFNGTTTAPEVMLEYKGGSSLVINGNGTTAQPSNIGDCNNTITKCTWLLKSAVTAGVLTLNDQDKLYVIYKLTKAGDKLKEVGGQINMIGKLGTAINEDIMGKKTIVVATGTDPLKEVTLAETLNTQIKIATAEGSTGFISTGTTTSDEYLGASEVIFGYLTIKNNLEAVADDGYTPWQLGGTGFTAGHNATTGVNTMLTVKAGGQFAASLTGSKGLVYLRTLGATGNMIPGGEAKSVTETEATWELTDDALQAITTAEKVGLVIKADGATMINVPEEDFPTAELTLSYAATNSMKDIKYPGGDSDGVVLTKYRQDGTICWVYNVAFPAATDEINVRITNDSTTEGCVKGSLFEKDGTPVGTGAVELGCVQGGATLYIGSAKIADLFNLPPDKGGRGIMLVTSTLPKMEMLSMLRAKSPVCYGPACSPPNNYNPLTNMSVGAHGVACIPN